MSLPFAALAVAFGAGGGALLRWWLALKLNAVWAGMPLGTLIANLAGGYLIGLALGFFAQHPQLSPEWRLLLVTGLLGGLTTFSTFSAEVVYMLQQGRWGWAFATSALHLLGSLVLTFLGLLTYQWLKAPV
ncbi:camphor resistance protein CrcB [Marinospirillum celere]|uniref:Fluoride-specific ion channel FluC n=1 Tax=Marinospirillum celere TaxID=1122252 RepID=A0A1I1JH19_9GAMM|nr:fluoride efflux transporter CrcB [Marinospirillum celere]SFC47766.1 camphor resistance protein CrcB [Marinospirillum celere]